MKFWIVFLIGMIPGFGVSFIEPIYNTDYGDLSDQKELTTIDVLKTYTNGAYDQHGQRHLVVFFSTTCGHCQNVAAKIGINQKGGQELSVWSFFTEPPDEIVDFLASCYGQEFDAFQMSDQQLYYEISGFDLPSVFLIDRDGSTMKHWAGDVVNYSALDFLMEIEP